MLCLPVVFSVGLMFVKIMHEIKLDKNNINNNAFGLLLNEWVFILKQSLSQ